MSWGDEITVTGLYEEMFAEMLHEASVDSHVPVSLVEKRTQGRDHPVIVGAGHFLQEDKGPEFAERVLQFMKETPLA